MVRRFGEAPEPALREQVAKALARMGVALLDVRRGQEAVTICEEVVRRFGQAPELALRIQVAGALFNKGVALGGLGRGQEAVECYDEVVSRFGKAPEPALKEFVARARGAKIFQEAFGDKRSEIMEKIKTRERRFRQLLSNRSSLVVDRSLLLVMRDWNSYTPALRVERETGTGGGYFVWHRGQGIVIDPGYDFVANFHASGCRIHDIHQVILTHAHGDHTADLESILTLLHEYNGKHGTSKTLVIYASVDVLRKFGGLKALWDKSLVSRVLPLNPAPGGEPQLLTLFEGATLAALPTYHEDFITEGYAVGVALELALRSGKNRKIVFASDTRLFPRKEVREKFEEARVDQSSGPGARRPMTIMGQYPKRWRETIDVLIPHLGTVHEEELRGIAAGESQTSNHLLLWGTIMMMDSLRPKVVILGEFGEELRDVKLDLVKGIRKLIQSYVPEVKCLVSGQTYLVYDLEREQFLCHQTCEFLPFDQIEMIQEHENGDKHRPIRVYLFRADYPTDTPKAGSVSEFHSRLEERKLPYLTKEDGGTL